MALPVKQIWKSAVEAGKPLSRADSSEAPIARTMRHLMAESTDKQAVVDFEGLLGRLADAEGRSRKPRDH
ncbi:hypothetical protein SAMN05880582_10241 [Rhizobium sp. RU20A]|uniref:hypothetical protein n=1 Tax=Rhizobium sp. RU20A TaxID=1907412 RepID=UPI000953E4A2|nr:hypothetical protein [Rhizobium sp. RU20A]SIQ52589.1 hypothetical protein SAMN05880582_10241 [Rhizobium sp. RU20A]